MSSQKLRWGDYFLNMDCELKPVKGMNMPDPNRMSDGITLWDWLIERHHHEALNALIAQGHKPSEQCLNRQPLIFAISEKNETMVNFFLRHGADCNRCDRFKLYPLQEAISQWKSKKNNLTTWKILENLLLQKKIDLSISAGFYGYNMTVENYFKQIISPNTQASFSFPVVSNNILPEQKAVIEHALIIQNTNLTANPSTMASNTKMRL